MSGVGIEDDDAAIAGELLFQMRGQLRVEFEKEERGFRVHTPHDLAGVTTFARPELGDYARLGKIHLLGNPPDHRPRTRDDGGDLERPAEESLQKKCAH